MQAYFFAMHKCLQNQLSRIRIPLNAVKTASGAQRAAHVGGEHVRQIPANHLLDEIEGVEERTMDVDASVAHGEELRGLQSNHAVVAALAQIENLNRHDVIALGQDQLYLAFAAGIAVLLRPDRFADPRLAVLLSEIWKQLDRRLRHGVEFVIATGHRPLDLVCRLLLEKNNVQK